MCLLEKSGALQALNEYILVLNKLNKRLRTRGGMYEEAALIPSFEGLHSKPAGRSFIPLDRRH